MNSSPASYSHIEILVNASPVGSKGELENISPVAFAAFENLQLAYDMVYNPKSTRFLRAADQAGIPTIGGLEMLIEQAVLQFRIWTGMEAPKQIMTESVSDLL